MFTVSKIYRTSRLDNYVALLLLICSGRCFHYCNIVNGYNIIIISFIQKQYEDDSNQEPSITPKRVVSNMIGNYLIDSCYTELTISSQKNSLDLCAQVIQSLNVIRRLKVLKNH